MGPFGLPSLALGHLCMTSFLTLPWSKFDRPAEAAISREICREQHTQTIINFHALHALAGVQFEIGVLRSILLYARKGHAAEHGASLLEVVATAVVTTPQPNTAIPKLSFLFTNVWLQTQT